MKPEAHSSVHKWGYLLILIVTYTLAGCGWLELEVAPGGLIFQDDFSIQSSGWDRLNEAEFTTDYADGGYHIRINEPETILWARPKLALTDVRVLVSASRLGGPKDNSFGIICRYEDANNFDFFLISSDGYSGIGTFQDGVKTLLTGEAMLPSEAILKEERTNHLQADCVGDQLSFYVNGALVGRVSASRNAHGDVGLIAGTGQAAGTDILFDNFTVTRP